MNAVPCTVPVLDIGGTHVTAATVDPARWIVVGGRHRVDIDSSGSAEVIIAGFSRAAAELGADPAARRWAVAMPDPFDYPRGIGRFHGVAKFESLDGVDVGAALRRELPGRPDDVVFCNDADAFTVGEAVAGAAVGSERVVGLTLGTGVGSGWVVSGRVADPGTPPGGRAHLLSVHGVALEDAMSRRAIVRGYRAATGDRSADVREIAQRARDGDRSASAVLARALRALGRALAAPIRNFAADLVVVGGSMSRSWELFEPWFVEGAAGVGMPPTRVAADPDAAPLIGAAHVAVTG